MDNFDAHKWFKKEYLAEDSLNDKAKRYFIQKVSRGEIDTLPENPKQAYLAQMMDRERSLKEDDLNEISRDAYDRMESLANQRDLNELKDLIMILGGEWANEGFENEDIVDYFEVLVGQLVRM